MMNRDWANPKSSKELRDEEYARRLGELNKEDKTGLQILLGLALMVVAILCYKFSPGKNGAIIFASLIGAAGVFWFLIGGAMQYNNGKFVEEEMLREGKDGTQ